MDDVEGRRGGRLTITDEVAVVAAGVRQRVSHWRFGGSLALAAIVLGSTLWAIYLVVLWSPGVSVPGSIGPFSNPSVIAAALWASGLIYALCQRPQGARLLFACSGMAEIVIATSSMLVGVELSGPSVYTWAGFAVLASLAGLWVPTGRDVTTRRVMLALVVLLVLVVLVEFAVVIVPAQTWPPSRWITGTLAAALVAAAVAVVVFIKARRVDQSARPLLRRPGPRHRHFDREADL